MGLDLGNAVDFARATLGDAAAVLGELAGRDPKEWDIVEGSYNGILFHVFKSKSDWSGAVDTITEHTGRRKIKYQFPYRDGQTTDDLGRKAEDLNFNILIFGPKYMAGFTKLMNEFNKPTPGDLIHPVRGSFRVVAEDITITHSSEKRKAVAIHVAFAEHNFSLGEFRAQKDSSAKGALASALDGFKSIENVLTAIRSDISLIQTVKKSIEDAIADARSGYQTLLTNMNRTFNDGTSVDIPSLLPVNDGSAAVPKNFSVVTSPSDPFNSVPADLASTTEAAQPLSVSQLQKQVNKNRNDFSTAIGLIAGSLGGQGSLQFYDLILSLKQTCFLAQDVLEKGVASSQAVVIEYRLPRVMSVREVAFANGLSVDRIGEIDLLNPSLLSLNLIEKDTVLKVPK